MAKKATVKKEGAAAEGAEPAKQTPAETAAAHTAATEKGEIKADPNPATEKGATKAAAAEAAKVEGKLAKVRRLRAEGVSRHLILTEHKDNDGKPFHHTTVAIQCAKVEKAKIKELGENPTEEDLAKWHPKFGAPPKPVVEKKTEEPAAAPAAEEKKTA